MPFNDCIILAGGSGTRLWPASSSKKPKQFLPVPQQTGATNNTGPNNFLYASVERAFSVLEESPDSRVIIIAGREHVAAIADTCALLLEDQRKRLVLIPEPQAKNTAPAIVCCLLYSELLNKGHDRTILVLTSDHLIRPMEIFKADAGAAEIFARQNEMAVFGIQPKTPNTGYGYIETSGLTKIKPELGPDPEPAVYTVLSFREKPDIEKAKEFLEAGNYYWNSGMFAFSLEFMLNEFKKNAPDLIGPFIKNLGEPDNKSYSINNGIRILDKWDGLPDAYRDTQKISFDYAIAEKCGRTVMVKAGFDWVDVGSWDVYADLLSRQSQTGPASVAGDSEIFNIDSKNSFVDSDIPVAMVNVDDLIVVIRTGKDGGPKAALIARKGETQKVQDIVKQIRDAGRSELL
ncbi:MAG: mannose-1-phosphate guanylyltransferase [Treponema sp.]|nr:mannose-1-phosphate guanylyltransferase [Treponema sp.]